MPLWRFPMCLTKRYPFKFKGWRFYRACIKVLSVALSEEKLSHYCANDMQLLKEHFEIAQ